MPSYKKNVKKQVLKILKDSIKNHPDSWAVTSTSKMENRTLGFSLSVTSDSLNPSHLYCYMPGRNESYKLDIDLLTFTGTFFHRWIPWRRRVRQLFTEKETPDLVNYWVDLQFNWKTLKERSQYKNTVNKVQL